MQEAKTSNALHSSWLKLNRDIFIPAHHTVTMSLDVFDICAAKYDPQQCFNSYFQNDDYIVLFDQSAKYEIRIPVPALKVLPEKHPTFTVE